MAQWSFNIKPLVKYSIGHSQKMVASLGPWTYSVVVGRVGAAEDALASGSVVAVSAANVRIGPATPETHH